MYWTTWWYAKLTLECILQSMSRIFGPRVRQLSLLPVWSIMPPTVHSKVFFDMMKVVDTMSILLPVLFIRSFVKVNEAIGGTCHYLSCIILRSLQLQPALFETQFQFLCPPIHTSRRYSTFSSFVTVVIDALFSKYELIIVRRSHLAKKSPRLRLVK